MARPRVVLGPAKCSTCQATVWYAEDERKVRRWYDRDGKAHECQVVKS
jgi:hypothetical protein